MIRIEIRSKNEAIIEGYVNVTARESRRLPSPRGSFIEVVKPGAFRQSLEKNSNIELTFNHQKRLGDVQSGVLEVREDNIGLYAKAHVSDKEVIQKALKGELTGWSFGFISQKDNWSEVDGITRRNLEEIRLLEVAILDKTPAYTGTSLELRDGSELVEYRNQPEKARIIAIQKPATEVDIDCLEKELELLKMKG